ncbi:MAG: tetraacyldisaccharide 4'-kinase [Alphaproteobacteria bacterium]|nr:tetraacyldisaccharide 4'-kinase [Alphaproteobacteria bacterium]
MRAPEFWQADNAVARLLAPAAWLYALAGRGLRRRIVPARIGLPVVCIGNATAGGSGKTPTVLALAALARQRGIVVHILSRGHGGRLTGPLPVDPRKHAAVDVGDEALLLAEAAPTWIARDRLAGALAARAAGAGLLLLDDGLQNPSLAKDLSLLVIDGGAGLGNSRVHPAGPLREPWAQAVARVAAVVFVHSPDGRDLPPPPLPPDLPVLAARLLPEEAALGWRGRRLLAFAGIGRPAKFFASLRALGAEVVAEHGFADHHRYSPDEVMRLVEAAQDLAAWPVTTAKDFVRLPPEARAMVECLRVRLAFDDPAAAAALVDGVFVRG